MVEPPTASAQGGAPALMERAAALVGLGAWECDLATERLTWTSPVYDLFGLPPDRPVARAETVALYHDECRETMQRLRADAIVHGSTFRIDVRIRRIDGEQRWMRLAAAAARDAGGRVVRLYGTKQDVTDERARWDALRTLAERDPLTGLYNRAVYQDRFLNAPRSAPLLAPLGALILFDLDGFKQVNDRHGHLAGDRCLMLAGQRLTEAFPDALLVTRVGGDEFAVLTRSGRPCRDLHRGIGRFLRRLGEPIPWQDGSFRIGASAGVAVASDPMRYDAQALFAQADGALYAAKRAGRNQCRIAAPAMDDQISS